MISDEIINQAHHFVTAWTPVIAPVRKYRLDCSWPSLGVLDLLLSPLLDKQKLTSSETQNLKGAAAYLGGIAHDCWSAFGDGSEITLSRSTDDDVIIQAKGGRNLPTRSTFTVNITKSLREVLADRGELFPIMSSFSRSLLPSEARVSQFALGLLTGLCPYGDGSWRALAPEKFASNILSVENVLATNTALHYVNIFPTEFLGGFPQLYASGQILPPLYFNEPVAGLHAATELSKYIDSVQPAEEDRKSLLLNIGSLAEERLSIGAAIVAVASYDEIAETRALLANRWIEISELRGAVVVCRKQLGKPADWLEMIDPNSEKQDFHGAKSIYQLDQRLGLIPLARVTSELLTEPRFFDLFRALAWTNLPVARDICAHLLMNQTAHNSRIMLQAAELDLQAAEFDACDQKLTVLKLALPTLSSAELLDVIELEGLLRAQEGKLEEGRALLSKVIRESAENVRPRSSFGYLDTLLKLGRLEEYVDALDFLRPRLSQTIELDLAEATSKVLRGDMEGANERYRMILSRVPRSVPAFAGLLQSYTSNPV